MGSIELRPMRRDEWDAVAALIHDSTNAWYEANRRMRIFTAGPGACRLFCEVYEALVPGCCVVAQDDDTGQFLGSCFYHPRETHVSLGILNVHPDAFGRGVATKLLAFIVDLADGQRKPLRLVSSAMNLDSFSLYTRAGFVPRAAFQDMLLPPPERWPADLAVQGVERVRPARAEDVGAMVALEEQVSGIRRGKDYRYFLENRLGIWHASVLDDGRGGIDGFLVSVAHPASNMLGPGVMRTEADAAALIFGEIRAAHRGRQPVFLVPVEATGLVRQLYAAGARNCEIHFAQIRGTFGEFAGIVMPTFMPETG